MTTDGQADFLIHRGRHLDTVEPLNKASIEWAREYIVGCTPSGMWTIATEYQEDTIDNLEGHGFIVEVK